MIYFVDNWPLSNDELSLLDKAILFGYQYLNIPENIQTVIEFTDDMDDDEFGNVIVEEDNSVIIFLNTDLEKSDIIPTVFHEMVHVQQILSGTMVVGSSSQTTTWNGQTYEGTYHQLPWEVDAFLREQEMIKHFSVD